MRRVRDTISPAEVRQVIQLDDICLDFLHEIKAGGAPPYAFQRILKDGAPSASRSGAPELDVVNSETLFRAELRRICNEELQTPHSYPVHEVIVDWVVDAWTRATFGRSTCVKYDAARGVLVACARTNIPRGRQIDGIEDMVFDLQQEENITTLGINDEFAVFDDRVTVWLGPMRLVGFGCKKCQNTRYVKQPINCTINLPDGADLQFLAASRPIDKGEALWTYPGDTYQPSCDCPPPERKPPKIARGQSASLTPVLGRKRELSSASEATNGDSRNSARPSKRIKVEAPSPPSSSDPEKSYTHTPVSSPEPEVLSKVGVPPRRRLPSPSKSPEPHLRGSTEDENDGDDVELITMDCASDPVAQSDVPADPSSIPATEAADTIRLRRTSTPPLTLPSPSTSASAQVTAIATPEPVDGSAALTSNGKAPGKTSRDTPDNRGSAPPRTRSSTTKAAAVVLSRPATSSPLASSSRQPLPIPSARKPRDPSPLVSAVILSTLSGDARGNRDRDGARTAAGVPTGQQCKNTPLATPPPDPPLVKIDDLPIDDSRERTTLASSPSPPSSYAYRQRPKLCDRRPIPAPNISPRKSGEDERPPRAQDSVAGDTPPQAQLQMDWLLATRHVIEADKAAAEKDRASAEAENAILRAITDSIQAAQNVAMRESERLAAENVRLLRELEEARAIAREKEESGREATATALKVDPRLAAEDGRKDKALVPVAGDEGTAHNQPGPVRDEPITSEVQQGSTDWLRQWAELKERESSTDKATASTDASTETPELLRIARLEDEIARLRELKQKGERSEADLKEQLREEQRKGDRARQELDTYVRQFADREEQLRNQQKRVKELDDKRIETKHQQQIYHHQLSLENRQLKQRLLDAEVNVRDAEDRATAAIARVQTVEHSAGRDSAEWLRRTTELDDQVRILQSRIRGLGHENDNLRARSAALERDLRSLPQPSPGAAAGVAASSSGARAGVQNGHKNREDAGGDYAVHSQPHANGRPRNKAANGKAASGRSSLGDIPITDAGSGQSGVGAPAVGRYAGGRYWNLDPRVMNGSGERSGIVHRDASLAASNSHASVGPPGDVDSATYTKRRQSLTQVVDIYDRGGIGSANAAFRHLETGSSSNGQSSTRAASNVHHSIGRVDDREVGVAAVGNDQGGRGQPSIGGVTHIDRYLGSGYARPTQLGKEPTQKSRPPSQTYHGLASSGRPVTAPPHTGNNLFTSTPRYEVAEPASTRPAPSKRVPSWQIDTTPAKTTARKSLWAVSSSAPTSSATTSTSAAAVPAVAIPAAAATTSSTPVSETTSSQSVPRVVRTSANKARA